VGCRFDYLYARYDNFTETEDTNKSINHLAQMDKGVYS
jgi:hypothetical protein